MKIALLIPTTSRERNEWNKVKDTYLYTLSIKTFLRTYDKEHDYIFYIGIDEHDKIFSNKHSQEEIKRFSLVFKNIDFKFIVMKDIMKGHLTKMWNILFKISYDEGGDYFFQCGDDINFHTKKWVNDSIKMLIQNNNIGISGPINNNNRILTQAMFSREHMSIFGWLFPEEIFNWCCDDWYNMVYSSSHFFPLTNHFCSNEGGEPRYVINNDKKFKVKFYV